MVRSKCQGVSAVKNWKASSTIKRARCKVLCENGNVLIPEMQEITAIHSSCILFDFNTFSEISKYGVNSLITLLASTNYGLGYLGCSEGR